MKKGLLFSLVVLFVCLFSVSAIMAVGEVPNGGNLLISEAGTYRLIGDMRGSVLVDPGQGDVRLIMDNFSVDGGSSAGIIALSGDSLTIELAENSINSVTDGAMNFGYNSPIFSQIPVSFEGTGSLDIFGNNQNAIRMENADLTFDSGNLNMMAPSLPVSMEGSNAGTVQYNGGNVSRNGMNSMMPMMSGNMEYDQLPEAVVTEAPMPAQQQEQSGNYFVQNQQPPMNQASFQQNQTIPSQNNGSMTNTQPNQGSNVPQQGNNIQSSQSSNMSQQGGMNTNYDTASSPSEIVSGTTYNSAMDLTVDTSSAITYYVSQNSTVKISESGTYIVTGISSDGNITVTKGTSGVVLVLENLDLTSTTGATLSVNKQAEVQIVISGNVTLTDAENPANEDSDDYDGAALKVKANSKVYITGDGQLTINGNAKNGIKGGDDSSIIIDGPKIAINAENDGINSNYDVTILSGDITINAADDAIHADHILTIGKEDGSGPKINVKASYEGLEATVVNIRGGEISVNSEDDAINAANSDGIYEGELDYSINMTGGKVTIKSQGDGMDSNGNINLIGGSLEISSASMGGEAGIDYDGHLYISNDFQLNNNSGIARPDNMPGGMNGGIPDGMNEGMNSQNMGQPGNGNQYFAQNASNGNIDQPGSSSLNFGQNASQVEFSNGASQPNGYSQPGGFSGGLSSSPAQSGSFSSGPSQSNGPSGDRGARRP